MAYTIAFDEEHKIIRVTAMGTGVMADALATLRDVRVNHKFQPDYGILCDYRKEEFVPAGPEPMGLGNVMQGFFSGQRLAFVASDERLIQALRTVISFSLPKVNAVIFSELLAAEAWLVSELR